MDDDRESRIRKRAHEIWEKGDRTHGKHDEHWSQAEREIDDGGSSSGDGDSARGWTGTQDAAAAKKPRKPAAKKG